MALLGLTNSAVIQYLKTEAGDRKARYGKLKEWMDLYQRLYTFGHYGKRSVGDIASYLPNDGTNIVNMMQGFLTAERVTLDAQPIEPEFSALPQASEVERWIWGVVQRNTEREGGNPYHQALFNALLLGMGVTFCYWDDDVFKRNLSFAMREGELELDEMGMPIAVLKDCPVRIKSVWPYYIFPEEGGPEGRYRSILRIERQSIASVQEDWDVELPEGKNKKPFDLAKADSRHGVDVVDYWGWEKDGDEWVVVNSVLAGKNSLVKEPAPAEGYTDLPYTIFSAYQGTFPEAEFKYQSALQAVHHSILQLADLQTAMIKAVRRSINFPIFRQLGPRGAGADIQIDKSLYNLVTLQPGETIQKADLPGFDTQTIFEQSWIKDQIREGSFSIPTLTSSIASGIAATRVVEQSVIRLAQPRIALEQAMKDDIRKIRSYVAAFAPNIPVRLMSKYRGVSGIVEMAGAELEKFVVDVHLGGEMPLDSYRKAQLGLSLAAMGERAPLSLREQLKRFWEVDQPEDQEFEKIYEMALHHPAIQAAALSDALKDLGVNMSPQEIMGMQPGAKGPGQLAETAIRSPGAVQAPQEQQSAEFDLMPQNASAILQGPQPNLDLLG